MNQHNEIHDEPTYSSVDAADWGQDAGDHDDDQHAVDFDRPSPTPHLDSHPVDALSAELDAFELVYLVPSRGRPDNIVDLAAAWARTTSSAAALVVAVDDDDPALADYLAVAERFAAWPWLRFYVGPRLRLGGTLNNLAPRLALGRLAVGFMGDDHRPRTSGWDEDILAALDEHPAAIVYADDLIQGPALPTAVAVSSVVITELGYMVPPGAVHLYLDNYWLELGRRLGSLRYLHDVVVEHCHPIAGTAPHDAGYAEVNAPEVYAADERVWHEYRRTELPDAVARLNALAAELGALS